MATKTAPYALSNPLSLILGKSPADFTRSDIMKVIEAKQIERVTFHYSAVDGKLKELSVPAMDRLQIETILAEGERVDGSSLFKGMVDMALSDLYIVPQYRTAFFNPFDEGSLDFVCRYLDKDGAPASFTSDNILARAASISARRQGSGSTPWASSNSSCSPTPLSAPSRPSPNGGITAPRRSSRTGRSSGRWSRT